MPRNFQVNIYSSDKTLYEGQAVSLIVPSESGYLGILAGHAPIAAKLKAGTITVKEGSGTTKGIEVSEPGYLEVLHNNVSILLG